MLTVLHGYCNDSIVATITTRCWMPFRDPMLTIQVITQGRQCIYTGPPQKQQHIATPPPRRCAQPQGVGRTSPARTVAHLFLSIFGLRSGFRAEAIHLLGQPLTDASHLHGRQLLQIIKEELGASALTHLLRQHLTHKVCHRIQHSVVPAQHICSVIRITLGEGTTALFRDYTEHWCQQNHRGSCQGTSSD